MRILSVVGKYYYGHRVALEPMYLEFTDPLRDLGHEVSHFDHIAAAKKYGSQRAGEMFVREVKNGGYALAFFQTACQRAEAIGEYVKEASHYAPIVAWNSDDDWAWECQTSSLAPYFTLMYTTYPHIYEANRTLHSNLRLSQWGCYDRFANVNHAKDLDFTFVGKVYGQRVPSLRFLKKKAGLKVMGHLSGMVSQPAFLYWPGIRKLTFRFPALYGRAIPFEQVNEVWNRSKISYTPMEASADPSVLQIKSRTFEMGLSGTLMLCQESPNLERYYTPGKEFIGFKDLEECADKAAYYLAHESERSRITEAYYNRTKAEHLWQHRFTKIIEEIGG